MWQNGFKPALDAVAPIWRWARRRPVAALFAAVFLFCFEVGVAALGAYAHREGWTRQWAERARSLVSPQAGDGDIERVRWQSQNLNQYTVEWARFRAGHPRSGGAIAEIAGNLVIATPQGRLSYLTPDFEFRVLDLQVPMGLSELRRSPLMQDPMFEIASVRVHDLFAQQTGANTWDLYATYSRFEGENCFQFVLGRARLEIANGQLQDTGGGWAPIYVARPGCIRYKDHSWRFVGEQAGGRIQFLNAHALLVSVGDHQFDGYNDNHQAPMDPNWDLGKLMQIDLETGRADVFASGLRNPQGLAVLRDGRIIETEHGPQGGDEINQMRRGANYGWPIITYGMNYGYPRRPWPTQPITQDPGDYTRPIHAFVPSIGIGQVIQAPEAEFPLWGDDDLFINSLRAQTLFHVRLDGDRVAYVEPLAFPGERLRDAIVLANGTVAILADSGNLIFLRNADLHVADAREFTVRGANSLPSDELLPQNETPAARGRRIFAIACASCHSVAGEIGSGPPLNGVVGRRVGSVPGFAYSPALSGQRAVWSEARLNAFMTDPQRVYPGTQMQPMSVSWAEAPHIVAYLKTTR